MLYFMGAFIIVVGVIKALGTKDRRNGQLLIVVGVVAIILAVILSM